MEELYGKYTDRSVGTYTLTGRPVLLRSCVHIIANLSHGLGNANANAMIQTIEKIYFAPGFTTVATMYCARCINVSKR